MKVKHKLIIILFVILSFFAINGTKADNNTTSKQILTSVSNDYTYERVYHDGFWWIVVYAPDGSKIDEYLDPIQ